MDIDQFNTFFQDYREKKPLMFEGETEEPATREEITEAEHQLSVQLPSEYKDYLSKYGGGYIGSINIFSVNEGSEWNLVKQRIALDLPANFLAITDDETGGYYGFQINGRECSDSVFYLHPDDGASPTLKFKSFFDYVSSMAFNV